MCCVICMQESTQLRNVPGEVNIRLRVLGSMGTPIHVKDTKKSSKFPKVSFFTSVAMYQYCQEIGYSIEIEECFRALPPELCESFAGGTLLYVMK